MAKYYYCISSSNTSISTSLIESSQRHEFVESTKTIHFACNDEYAYFVVDKSLGEFQFQVNIFRGGFEDAVEITYNSTVYLAYRSHQKLKGEIDIELINTNVSTGHTVALSEIRPRADFAVLQAQYVGYCGQRMDKLIRDWQEVCLEIESIIDQNSKSIATNTTNIATNTANISTNTSDINTLKSKIETLEGGIKLKGRVDSVSLLPATAEIGDLYLVGLTTDADLAEYLYTSAGHWELLGKLGDIDLSDYAKKTDIPTKFITSGSQTSTSSADGGTNIYTFTYADGTTSTFTVKNGTKGSTGAQGPQGEKGDTGAAGPQGPKGETGATGSTGPQGPKGDTGAAGANGTNGTNGTSCTHSWNGTTLTVTSASGTSSANLKGEKGDKGDTGSTGPKGDTGPQGPAGQNATTTAVATTSANGLMSTDHVTKLNGIATGATAVSESTVSGWGFTKNSGTYSKPSTGIPKTDLASAVQTSLGLADTALQSHQDISGKLDKSGGTMTGNLIMGDGFKSVLMRNSASWRSGIGYDTKGNEALSLWATNSVTRLRWYAGKDMSAMSTGTMMDITPDFEISKADGTAKGYIAGSQIVLTSYLGTSAYKSVKTVDNVPSDTGWTNKTTDDGIVPTMTFLAHWNGAYSSSNGSNLRYCKQGEFGSIVTHDESELISTSTTNVLSKITSYDGCELTEASLTKVGNLAFFNCRIKFTKNISTSVNCSFKIPVTAKNASMFAVCCWTSGASQRYTAHGSISGDTISVNGATGNPSTTNGNFGRFGCTFEI